MGSSSSKGGRHPKEHDVDMEYVVDEFEEGPGFGSVQPAGILYPSSLTRTDPDFDVTYDTWEPSSEDDRVIYDLSHDGMSTLVLRGDRYMYMPPPESPKRAVDTIPGLSDFIISPFKHEVCKADFPVVSLASFRGRLTLRSLRPLFHDLFILKTVTDMNLEAVNEHTILVQTDPMNGTVPVRVLFGDLVFKHRRLGVPDDLIVRVANALRGAHMTEELSHFKEALSGPIPDNVLDLWHVACGTGEACAVPKTRWGARFG
jgi:hypothetical protein